MIDPPISRLLQRTEDRFTLCVSTAKRARQLLDGAKCLTEVDSRNPVTIAVNEIDQDKVKFKRIKKKLR